MDLSTLPRHARTPEPGWARPYPVSLFSPVFYADGDQDDDTDEADTDSGADKDADAEDDQADEADPDGAEDLGDKGKKALDSMKAKLKTEREKRRAAEAKLKPEGEGDADQLQVKADLAATAKANTRILRSEIKAAATGKLINPKDALVYLDLDQFEFDDDGQVDEDEIADAIDDLLKERPYLGAATAKRFQGTGDGGAARKAGRPKQLSQQDLRSMSAEAIDKARLDGRLDDLMGGK